MTGHLKVQFLDQAQRLLHRLVAVLARQSCDLSLERLAVDFVPAAKLLVDVRNAVGHAREHRRGHGARPKLTIFSYASPLVAIAIQSGKSMASPPTMAVAILSSKL